MDSVDCIADTFEPYCGRRHGVLCVGRVQKDVWPGAAHRIEERRGARMRRLPDVGRARDQV